MKRFTMAALTSVALLSAPAFAQDTASSSSASSESSGAAMEPVDVTMNAQDGSNRGTVTVTPTANGLLFEAKLSGLEPGVHAFHVHETGQCEGDFTSAGGHYNPTDKEHGFKTDGGPHAGDMENFTVADDGTATFSSFNPNLTMTGGDAPIMDSDGSAIMVHGGADDYQSQPSGDAGDRVACGVIEPAS